MLSGVELLCLTQHVTKSGEEVGRRVLELWDLVLLHIKNKDIVHLREINGCLVWLCSVRRDERLHFVGEETDLDSD